MAHHTSSVLGIQNEHFVQWPAPLRNEFVVLRGIPASAFAGDKDSVVKKNETHRMRWFVGCGIQGDAVHLSNDVSSWRSRHKLRRPFDLCVQVLHLVCVEYTKVSDGRPNIASTICWKMSGVVRRNRKQYPTSDRGRFINVE